MRAPGSMAGDDLSLRTTLATGCRILAMEGHGDLVWGHMSVRQPGTERFWMKPADLGLEEIGAEDPVLVDFDGQQVGGHRRRHGEWPIHSEVFRRRPEVGAVVHTHPLLSTVFGSSGHELEPVTHEGSLFVPPPVPHYGETTALIVTKEQGEGVAQALGSHTALFMRNHGVVIAGATVEEAVFKAIVLEKACRAMLAALAVKPYEVTSSEEALLKRRQVYHEKNILSAWSYFCRKLERWDGVPKYID
jgi:L-ribulose-5-phosphate 4-epimerase